MVLQLGGATGEHYFHSFTSAESAIDFIRSAETASYECYGPEEITFPEIAELTLSARQLLQELSANPNHTCPSAEKVKQALTAVEQAFLGA